VTPSTLTSADFEVEAFRLIADLEREAESEAREAEIDSRLEALRESWRRLDQEAQNSSRTLTARIAALVSGRPAGSASGRSETPSRPQTPAEAAGQTVLIADEQEEAALALQGLEGIELVETVPARTFEGTPDPDALLAHMGYDEFRPGQQEAVQAALDGRDSLIVMPTGGGKSLCYQLPGLASPSLTLVVSPLIALMADQVKRLRSEGHPAVMFASGLSDQDSAASWQAVQDGSARIAYCSPERFGSAAFLNLIGGREIDLLAIDEAHCLSEWGHDFRPDYLRLPRVAERLGRPPVMACTATATPQVVAEIAERMGMNEPVEIHSGFDRPNLSFDTIALEGKGSKARKQVLLELGLSDPANRPAIVYCGTRKSTEEVAEDLRAVGVSAVAYHAGMAPDERASAQHRFMEGDAEVVVATNAFGMGIDKADVRSVWHWAIPSSVEAYYQEAGRAGRDGDPARAVLLAMRADLGRLVRFNEQRKMDPSEVLSYVDEIRRAAGHDEAGNPGSVTIEAPRSDEERVRLAVGERSGALHVDPAPGGRLQVIPGPETGHGPVRAACRVAEDRGWVAYRAVESFSFSTTCRRRQLLEHFGDHSPGAPTGRCCDICDPIEWLPDPETIEIRKPRKASGKSAGPPPELAPQDEALYEDLRRWRLEAAGDRPAFHVASNRTLTAIATVKPLDDYSLMGISGVGPAFMEKYGADVLRVVSRHV
jgi:RecQ family ATP-dependent DNA helicase